MKTLAETIAGLIEKHGGNKAAISRRMENKVSPQLLGLYAKGKNAGGRTPKSDFFVLWKKYMGDDIKDIMDGKKVSNETKNETPDENQIGIDDFRAWINDARVNSEHLRTLNLEFVQIIKALSSKVGASDNAQ